jgi:alanine dehydrogenase
MTKESSLFGGLPRQEGAAMKSPAVMLLTRGEISSLLTLRDCIDVVETAFRMHAEGMTLAPGLLHIGCPDGEFHIKAGGLKLDRIYFGLKANGGFFHNMERYGLPNIQGGILLFDGEKGSLLAVMDSMEITIQRTGAATAVAAKYLARPDSSIVTICGCGRQGRIQLRALKLILPGIELAFAWDVDSRLAALYADEMSAGTGIAVAPTADLEYAAGQSDIVVTCTPSKRYYLRRAYARAGTFIAAIGADSPDKQELEPSLLVGNKVVVDMLDQCASVGELHHALELGLMGQRDIHGELAQVVAGHIPGRTSAQEIIVFDATGTALQDVAAAVLAYERALQQGRGLRCDLSA